jgi:hypothetical protein
MRIEAKNGSVSSRPKSTWRAVVMNAWMTRLVLNPVSSASFVSCSNSLSRRAASSGGSPASAAPPSTI